MCLGLMLLCAVGNLHVSWTIWRLYLSFDYQNVETHVLLAWFVGAAGGAMFGAFLNTNWSKILIYVRTRCPSNEFRLTNRTFFCHINISF